MSEDLYRVKENRRKIPERKKWPIVENCTREVQND
jgi:hypothetical protein